MLPKEKKPKEEPEKGKKGKGKGKGEEKEPKGKGKGKAEKEPKGKGKGKGKSKEAPAAEAGVQKAKFEKVKTIRPDSAGLNLKVTVSSVEEAPDKGGKRGGKGKPRMEAVIGDETACVTLQLSTAEQIETVTKGSSIVIRNASVNMVKGFIKLTVDRWGKIEKMSDELPHKVNTNKDISGTEYELVAL